LLGNLDFSNVGCVKPVPTNGGILMKLSLIFLSSLIAFCVGAAEVRAGVFYGVDGCASCNQLVTVDASTGIGSVVGLPFGINDVRGLAFDRNSNTLFGASNATKELLTIDTITGLATTVGPWGAGSVPFLSFDPNTDTLFGINEITGTDNLVKLNTSTGVSTIVGPLVGSLNPDSIAFDPNSNILYGIDGTSDELLNINTSTGAVTPIVSLSLNSIGNLAFDSETDTLYGIHGVGDSLYTINTSTGVLTLVHPTNSTGFGLIEGFTFAGGSTLPIPEPSALLLLLSSTAALVGHGWWRKREKKVPGRNAAAT